MSGDELRARINGAIGKFSYKEDFRSMSSIGQTIHYLTNPSFGSVRIDAEIYNSPQKITLCFQDGSKDVETRGIILGYGIDGANWTEGETNIRKCMANDLADLLIKSIS